MKNANQTVAVQTGEQARGELDSDTFFRAYVECALWSSTDQDGETLDAYRVYDVADETLLTMYQECVGFRLLCADHVEWDSLSGGHDFWLTRNRHGAGFWDGDWSEPAASFLTNASKSFGGVDLYVSNGQIRA